MNGSTPGKSRDSETAARGYLSQPLRGKQPGAGKGEPNVELPWTPSAASALREKVEAAARAERIRDICDELVEEQVPPDVLAPIYAYADSLKRAES